MKVKPTHITIAVASVLIIVGLFGPVYLTVLGVFIVLVVAAGASEKRKTAALTLAAPGATRVETVKSGRVNLTVERYTKAGWEVASQSSAKSFGSQARVTITFRKPPGTTKAPPAEAEGADQEERTLM